MLRSRRLAALGLGPVVVLTAFAVVLAGPAAPGNAAVTTIPPVPAGAAATAMRTPVGLMAACIAGTGGACAIAGVAIAVSAGVTCYLIEACNEWAGNILDGRSDEQALKDASTPTERPPGDTLAWVSTPGASAGPDDDFQLSWAPVSGGSPGGQLRADVRCTVGGNQSIIGNWQPVTNIYPGSPAATFDTSQVCGAGGSVDWVRAWISSASFCDPCGGMVTWESAAFEGSTRQAQTVVKCRFPDGTTVTLESAAQAYPAGTDSTPLTVPSCQDALKDTPNEDGFSRADSATSLGATTAGHTWTNNAGTCGISGGIGQIAASSETRCTVQAPVSDGNCGLTVTRSTVGGGLFFRGSADGATGLLWLRDGGFYTKNPGYSLHSNAGTFAQGDRIRVNMAGQTLKFYVNDILKSTKTVAFNEAQKGCGVRHDTGDGPYQFDDVIYPGVTSVPTPGFPVETTIKCGLHVGFLAECVKTAIDPIKLTDPVYETCFSSATACQLDLFYEGVRCQLNTTACVDWAQKVGVNDTGYSCRWGSITMQLTDCAGLVNKYQTQTQTEPQPSPSPTTSTGVGTAPNPTTSPAPADPQAAPAPGQAGTATETDTAGKECWPTGWGVFNPAQWVLQPVKCALRWAFVPRSTALQASWDNADIDWCEPAPGAVACAVQDVMAPFGTIGEGAPTDCLGGSVALPDLRPGHADPVIHPWQACNVALVAIQDFWLPFVTGVVYLSGFLVGARMLARTIGAQDAVPA